MKAYRYRYYCDIIEEIEIVSITEKMYKYVEADGPFKGSITRLWRVGSNYYVSDSFEDVKAYALNILKGQLKDAKAEVDRCLKDIDTITLLFPESLGGK